jgi:hydrogenase maturation protein HypF
MIEGKRIQIRGTVQGVGFRPWVFRLATEERIAGRVRNDTSGVTIDAFGLSPALASFLARLGGPAPPAASIRTLTLEDIPAEDADCFSIVESDSAGERAISIPPDLATCPECLAEVFDPANRRFEYPFTNCTHCGPRFTIATGVPYDRPATTMSRFPMCVSCRREYESVLDRRFHAQPNACAACGPSLVLTTSSGETFGNGNPIAAAARALRDGLIVAIKGLGGFHLACDAGSPLAVERLRRRKHRDEKPFAVMVESLQAARQIAKIDGGEERLLTAVEAPIVLLKRLDDAPLAREIAPANPLVGLFLPYTPLHHLLLARFGGPLVMTSGNVSDEPMACANREALEKLSGIADLFLLHDREVAARADDSVVRVIGGRPTVLRRSRGYVPRAVPLARPFDRPVLACGAHLKNTFCFGMGDSAWLGPHVGDLENLEIYRSYEEAIDRMERFLSIRPEVVAHDLHPDYLSTVYARSRPEETKIAVQHHHAHVASAMAEHAIEGPVIGVAYDGTGYGTDGTAWGGEILLARFSGFERMGTFRPIPLPGGDLAIREVWRIALGLVDDAFDGEPPPFDRIPLFREIPETAISLVRRMAATHLSTPLARGVGRYFDGIGALVLGRRVATYEGQVAIAWNLVADPAEAGVYPYDVERDEVAVLDLRPLVRAVLEDLGSGCPAPTISGRFHNTIARATKELVHAAAMRAGRVPVVLTGGCFQNALLAERTVSLLEPKFRVYTHGEIPPGDGGIALGQALVADAIARGEEH